MSFLKTNWTPKIQDSRRPPF